MNDLLHSKTHSNYQDLQWVEPGTPFLVKLEEVDIENEFQFYLYPFVKVVEKLLNVLFRCTSPILGLKFAYGELYGYVYIQNIESRLSVTGLFISLKAACNTIRNSYHADVAGYCIFLKADDSEV